MIEFQYTTVYRHEKRGYRIPIPVGEAYRVENTSVWWMHWMNENILIVPFTDIRGLTQPMVENSGPWDIRVGLPHNTTYHVVEDPVI